METPRVPESGSIRFRVTLRTRWSDEDNQQVLNNAVYMTLLEEARLCYFGALALLEDDHFPFLLAQTNVVFTAPGRGGVEVVVEAITVSLGHSSFTQAYRVKDASTGDVWCEAEARLVAWDGAQRRKRALPSDLRARIAAFEGLS